MASERWLVIAEKPSVATDISKAIGGFTKKDGYFESDGFFITWAVGHLVELLSPEDLDPKYKSWLLKDLPIIPAKFQYKAKDGQKERLENIRSLAKKADVVGFINACDAGREGELIFREIYDYCESKKPIKRLWLQSMTTNSIRKEFNQPRDGKEFDPLGDAARCRAESDWLIGMNGTRAITKRLKSRNQKNSWSVGRVQTPTLALIVRRENEILKHRAEPFWTVEGKFSTPSHEYMGQWFDPAFKKPQADEDEDAVAVREKDDRIFSKEKLDSILLELNSARGSATATETRKESKENAPQMFDLTTLQREANRRFSMSASRTMQAAQRLYEKHKVLTYPRTDSKYLPEDYVQNVTDILKNFAQNDKTEIGKACARISKNGMLNKDRVFNNKFISDHFAIIPTGERSENLEGDDARIFDLVLRRFISAFMSHAVWARVERISQVGAHSFRTRVSDLQEPGWREVYGLESQEESNLPKLDENNPNAKVGVKVEDVQWAENATKPLPRFSEAKLLSLMEHAGRSVDDDSLAEALKEKGIGTPATRAEIIENLIHREYATRQGKNLRPTSKSIRLMDALSRIPVDELAGVELTGEMERDLRLVEKGQKSRKDFMKNMVSFTTEIVEKAKTFDLDKLYENEAPLGECPLCKKGKIVETFWVYKCTQEECEFVVWKEKNQRYMDRSLVSDLLRFSKVGPIEFANSAGIPYQSMIAMTEKGVMLLDENGNPIDTQAANQEVLSEEQLPTTYLEMPGRVIETGIAYLCEFGTPAAPVMDAAAADEDVAKKKAKAKKKTAKDDDKKPAKAKKKTPPKRLMARMPKVLCHHNVTMDEFKNFILTGMTPVISDFKSKKGRNFSAKLHLKSNGRFEFKFEPRPKAPPAEGAAEGETAAKKAKATKKTASKAKVVRKTQAAATDT